MKIEDIRNAVKTGSTLIGFEYKGRTCHIDPYYNSNTKQHSYLLYCDGDETTVYSIDDVINTAFIAGKSIADISEDITELKEF